IPNRTSRRVQAGQEHLVDLHYFLDSRVLANDFTAKGVVKVAGITAATVRIKGAGESCFHRVWPCFLPFLGLLLTWETGQVTALFRLLNRAIVSNAVMHCKWLAIRGRPCPFLSF